VSQLLSFGRSLNESTSAPTVATYEPLLVLSGRLIWLWSLMNHVKHMLSDQRITHTKEQRTAILSISLDLHPEFITLAVTVWKNLTLQILNEQALSDTSSVSVQDKDDLSRPLSIEENAAHVKTVALHVRLGDLREVTGNLTERMSAATAWLRVRNVSVMSAPTFIATDSDRETERAVMLQAFPLAQMGADAFLASCPLMMQIRAAVLALLMDKAMCVQADYFVGSRHSSYTNAIKELRAIHGHSATSSIIVPG
jgi:hypothetical protein